MTRLHLLGTGSGLQNPERAASSYLLEGDQGDVLFDAGEPVSATLARRRYDGSRLAGIVISHTHADHLGGLPMLMQQLHISGRTAPLALFGPGEFTNRAGEHLSLYYLFPEALGFELHVHALAAGTPIELAGFRIHPSATTHLAHYREQVERGGHAQKRQAFAFAVETPGSRLFYSGDVGSFADIREVMPGARFAVLDSTHIDLEEVAAWAESHPDTTVILSHVSPRWRTDEVPELLRKHPKAGLRLAVEGETLDL